MRITLLAAVLIALAGCASSASYNPTNAKSVQDQIRNANIYQKCPAGSALLCEVEGGGLVGKTYSNCRCAR